MIRSIVWGVAVILVGTWLLAAKLYPGAMLVPAFRLDWPILIVALGLAGIGEGIVRGARRHRWGRVWWGTIVALVGVWIWASNRSLLDVYQFSRTWPILLVVFGTWILYRGLRRWSSRRVLSKSDVITDLERGRISVEDAVTRLQRARACGGGRHGD
jgi:hypothetical protein